MLQTGKSRVRFPMTVTRIGKTKGIPKIQNILDVTSGQCDDVRSADENKYKNVSLQPVFKKKKRQYIYSSIEDSEVVLVFERNNAYLKKLSSFSKQRSK
jgi:hypothetical protein